MVAACCPKQTSIHYENYIKTVIVHFIFTLLSLHVICSGFHVLLVVHFYTIFNPSCLDVQRVKFCSEMYCHEKQTGGGELCTYCFVWNVSRIQISRFVCTFGLERGAGSIFVL
jgi:hypothetical protein